MTTTPTPTELAKLLDASGFTEEAAAPLVAYISSNQEYSFEACRRLLKVYQFHPHVADQHLYAKVLLLGLMQYPSTDHSSLASMVPDQTVEPVATIVRCADHLDACQFSQFWTEFKTLESTPDFDAITSGSTDQLRSAIASVLALTYRTAPLEVVTAALNTTEIAVDQDVVEQVTATTATFHATSNNTKRGQVFQEGVSFTAIASMLHKSAMASQ